MTTLRQAIMTAREQALAEVRETGDEPGDVIVCRCTQSGEVPEEPCAWCFTIRPDDPRTAHELAQIIMRTH